MVDIGLSAIPSDNYIRPTLDGAPTAAFDPLFLKAVEAPEVLTPLRHLGERNAVKRWLARHGATLGPLRLVFLGDDLFACKPSSHRTVTAYLYGAKLEEHRETVLKRGKRATTVYR